VDINGRIPLFFFRGRVDLRLAMETSPLLVDLSLDAMAAQRAQLARGDAKLLRFCFMKQVSWQPTAMKRELDTWLDSGPSAADFRGARVLEITVMTPDEKYGSRDHQALVKLECTEKQQLLIYLSNRMIPLCGAWPLVVFQTYGPMDMFGGRRSQRLMQEDPANILHGKNNETRLSEQGSGKFLQELEEGIAPPGLTASEQLLASASKSNATGSSATTRPWGGMMTPADGNPAKTAAAEDKKLQKAEIKAKIEALQQLLLDGERPEGVGSQDEASETGEEVEEDESEDQGEDYDEASGNDEDENKERGEEEDEEGSGRQENEEEWEGDNQWQEGQGYKWQGEEWEEERWEEGHKEERLTAAEWKARAEQAEAEALEAEGRADAEQVEADARRRTEARARKKAKKEARRQAEAQETKDAEETLLREQQKASARQNVSEGHAAAKAAASIIGRKGGNTPMALKAAQLAVQQLANMRQAQAIKKAQRDLNRDAAAAGAAATARAEASDATDIDRRVGEQVAIKIAEFLAQQGGGGKRFEQTKAASSKRSKSPLTLDPHWKRMFPPREHRGYPLFSRANPISVLLFNSNPKSPRALGECRFGINVGGKKPNMRGVLEGDIQGLSNDTTTPPPSNKKQTRLPFAAKGAPGPAAPAGTKRKLDQTLLDGQGQKGAASPTKAKTDTLPRKSKAATATIPASTTAVPLTAAEKVKAAMRRF
jgi:hypothetical protein